MSQIFAYVPTAAGLDLSSGGKGADLLSRFKEVKPSISRDEQWVHYTLAPRLREKSPPWVEDPLSGVWLTWTGVWTYEHGLVPALNADALLRRYLLVGASRLGAELQGQFVIIIGDARSRDLLLITDRCGSLHFFHTTLRGGVAVCSSSAVLSALRGADHGEPHDEIDPVGLNEFIGTGVIYDDRTLWSHVKKIGAGAVYRVSGQGIRQQRYWSFADITPERYGLDEAVERVMDGLTQSVKQIGEGYRKIVSDLTGGYDSRALLCGLLNAGLTVETTVSGPANSADVLVSRQIARRLSIPHTHRQVSPEAVGGALMQALRWTDGEYNMFDYARIAATHTQLSERYSISLNGSFGELARGYWWELIWPGLTARTPLSGQLLSGKRFAAISYDSGVFLTPYRLHLQGHMTEALNSTLADLRHFPRSSQMDALYYYQRMGRWQGRIVSCTNQIWSCVSPFSFPQTLVPILEARADVRLRSKLIRTLLARYHPVLASIPLEHGYPPQPLTAFNFWKFLPLLGHYVHLIERKLAPRIAGRLGIQRNPDKPPAPMSERYPMLFDAGGLGIDLEKPVLSRCGYFDESALKQWFSRAAKPGGSKIEQWQRMVTVELLLRTLQTM